METEEVTKIYKFLSLILRAAKNSKGLHSRKDLPIHRVADISGV